MRKRLPQAFYRQDTLDVAHALLGQRLVHVLPDGTRLAGRIVETEAYLGVEDPAAHSYGGNNSERTRVMFGPPGRSYVYFIYGMHYCINVVCKEKGTAEAVLIRAIEPVEGVEHMQRARGRNSDLGNGPGKLCQALQITRAHNDIDLVTSPTLFIEQEQKIKSEEIVEGPRIGVDYAGDASHWPLRFGIRGHMHVSPKKFPNYLE